MKKLTKLFTYLALLFASQAVVAQTKPTDVPDYVPIAATYEAGTATNVLGNGSTPQGGVMPVLAKQPADIPATASGWVMNTDVGFLDIASTGVNTPGAASNKGTEAKFRTVANLSLFSFDDPVRNFGQPGATHCHQFFGSTTVNAFSTYATLRTRANQLAAAFETASTIAGGPFNGTAYWAPCVLKVNAFGDGKTYIVKPATMVVYYNEDPTAKLSRIPRGARYVLGMDMDDPDGVGRRNEVSQANAQSGTAGRYACGNYLGTTAQITALTNRCFSQSGFIGWKCTLPNGNEILGTDGNKDQPNLKNADGSDPWSGNCVTGGYVTATAIAPNCYDGNNLWAPGGYKHFRPLIYDSVKSTGVCPKGWYRVPALQITILYKHQGFADFGTWRLSSDDMAAQVAGHAIANGASFHTDWLGGWDDRVFFGSADGSVLGWQKFCAGVDGNTPHECDGSTFNATSRLRGAFAGESAPDLSRLPQVDLNRDTYNTTDPTKMQLVPTNLKGPATLTATPRK